MVSVHLNNLPFDEGEVTDQTRNFALGQFMTAWSQVECIYGFLFRELSQINPEIAIIIFDRVGVKEQLEIVTELAERISSEDFRSRATKALSEVQNISKARNKIVHANWGLLNGEPARFWQGLSTARLQALRDDTPRAKSDRQNYVFTLPNLRDLTERCLKLRAELESIHDRITLERLNEPPPPFAHGWPFRPDKDPTR